MEVTLADTLIKVTEWPIALDELGKYSLKIRRSPQEIKEDKARGIRTPKQFRYEEDSVFTVDENERDVRYFFPGFWPRVKAALKKRNIQYSIVDLRNSAIRPAPDYSKISDISLRPGQGEVIAAVVTSDCGLVTCTVGFGKSMIAAILCRIYPTLNIVITTNSVTVVKQLYDDISKMCKGEVGIISGSMKRDAGKRIIVSTLNSLHLVDATKVQLLLVDECHAIGANSYGKAIARFLFARRFGFSASPIRNDGSGKVLEALLGPVIATATYEEAQQAGMVTPIAFMMLPTECPTLGSSLPDVLMQRISYFRNFARNKAIADCVKRIRSVYDGQILIMVGE